MPIAVARGEIVAALAADKAKEALADLVTKVEDRISDGASLPEAAAAAKLTLVDAAGQRILPAYYSDNYVSLLPGERRVIAIRYPATVAGAPRVTLSGWNVPAATVPLG